MKGFVTLVSAPQSGAVYCRVTVFCEDAPQRVTLEGATFILLCHPRTITADNMALLWGLYSGLVPLYIEYDKKSHQLTRQGHSAFFILSAVFRMQKANVKTYIHSSTGSGVMFSDD